MMNGLWLGGILAGLLSAVQGVVIGRTAKTGGILLTASILSAVQGLAPFVLWIITRKGFEPIDWRWLLIGGGVSGLMGVAILALNSSVLNQMGAATAFVLVTAGLMGASLVLDHLGWSGVSRSALEPARLAGVGFVLVGAWLMTR